MAHEAIAAVDAGAVNGLLPRMHAGTMAHCAFYLEN